MPRWRGHFALAIQLMQRIVVHASPLARSPAAHPQHRYLPSPTMCRKESAMKHKMSKAFVRSLALIALVLMLSLWPGVAQADTFNIADGDVAGLIVAINTANANGVPDTINLAPGGIYTLTAVDNTSAGYDGGSGTGLPIITSQITINGNGATIQRSSAAGTSAFRIFFIEGPFRGGSGNLTLDGVTIRGGGLFSTGGGILNFTGRLKVIDSLVTGNRGDGGAGIYNGGGMVELINSTVSSNTDRFFGAGIYNDGGRAVLTLVDSSITGNSGRLRGTGIYNDAGTVTLINGTVSGNTNGAGIMNDGGGKSMLINSTVSGNTHHPTEGGGGIVNGRGGTATLFNSTVTGNTNISGAGGIINASLKNTIVANNSPSDCGGAITTLGHNIASDASCNLTGSGDLNSTDPLLGPLAGNGGPTQTHALLLGSPAIDAVPLADCTDASGNPVATDQRGVARPQGAACDIGSVELILNQLPVANAGPDQTVEATSSSGAPVTLNGSSSFDPDGDSLTYNWTGPFGAVSGVSPTVTLPLGTHTVTLTVSDGQATATDTVYFTVQDTTPPETTITSVVDGNGAAGASGGSTLSSSITFTFTGIDAVGVAAFQCSLDGTAYTPCASPMGYSALAIGNHIFQVWAIDTTGNVDPSPAGFSWAVVTPVQATQNLIAAINSMGLPTGVANSLSAPLGQASALLNDNNPNNDSAACGKLNAFINQVNAKTPPLTGAQATQLLQAANAIKASLGC